MIDSAKARKSRGAFFTPEPIADYLAAWAVGGDPDARILDPTCGEAVFLLAAGRYLRECGCPPDQLDDRLFGVDLHSSSLDAARDLLKQQDLSAHLLASDFFELFSPGQLDCQLPLMDAVIGNPPFVRYQQHAGGSRKRSAAAALAQGVRLSGLASSWAALLVHACSFLKPDGRLAMVLPAELLTVNYAEPVRRWLLRRFENVNLVLFEDLQFDEVLEKVVLLVAEGEGPAPGAFSLHYLQDADELRNLGPFDGISVPTKDEGKWTDLFLPTRQRNLFRAVENEYFTELSTYGRPELGTVTGANDFFAINEKTRLEYGLEERQLIKISPPGTRHLRGMSFKASDWQELLEGGERVWLLCPEVDDHSPALARYVSDGESREIHTAYKCRIRDIWWRPSAVPAPDLFFTYMSHRYPRLVANSAGTTFLNSMHGIRINPGFRRLPKLALPLLVLNSVTMIGAEVNGRSYGGGILKMEPGEAASLPVPSQEHLLKAWELLKDEAQKLDVRLRGGIWTNVVKRVDEVLLHEVLELDRDNVVALAEAAASLRRRRIGNGERPDGG
jgi:adenine-specific DNA-methyltransferase